MKVFTNTKREWFLIGLLIGVSAVSGIVFTALATA